MRKKRPKYSITQEELKRLLTYDPSTGIFYWSHIVSTKMRMKRAGTINWDGYEQIQFLESVYKSHILAWFYVYGHWPTNTIDHIDGNRSHNAIHNLRELAHTDNCMRRAPRGTRNIIPYQRQEPY